jgi:hypothetical protein
MATVPLVASATKPAEVRSAPFYIPASVRLTGVGHRDPIRSEEDAPPSHTIERWSSRRHETR